jgi:hypothetical protein
MNDYGLGTTPLAPGSIPHYYGDYVRVIFIVAAALAAFAIPVWGDVLPVGTFAQVAGIVILVVLAGLTNPHGTFVLWVDAIVSAIGVLFIENTAIALYSIDEIALFFAREILVLLLLFAMYFSIKTVRAISMHQIGHMVEVGEFEEPEESVLEEEVDSDDKKDVIA